MINAIALLKVRRDSVKDVADRLVELEGVTEVYTVAGQYDLVAIVRAADEEAVSEVVTEHMLQMTGILTSETLIAFRTGSRFDLGALFGIKPG
jgi:DNA-binding Lrp family transcriptional regulator